MSTSRQEVAGGLAGGVADVDPEASGEVAAVAASKNKTRWHVVSVD